MQTSARLQSTGLLDQSLIWASILYKTSGTNVIYKSNNVSSITDEATGKVKVNFTVATPDVNYTVLTSVGGSDTGYLDVQGAVRIGQRATTYVQCSTVTGNAGSYTDTDRINVVIIV